MAKTVKVWYGEIGHFKLEREENVSHRNFEWTPEKVALLTQLWNTGLSAAEIGLKLGCNKNTVIGKAHRLGLKKRRPINAPGNAIASVTLHELTENICHWPVGNPGEPDFHFCGEPSILGKSYCLKHYNIGYTKHSKESLCDFIERSLDGKRLGEARRIAERQQYAPKKG